MPGIVCIGMVPFQSYAGAELEMSLLNEQLKITWATLKKRRLLSCVMMRILRSVIKEFLMGQFYQV